MCFRVRHIDSTGVRGTPRGGLAHVQSMCVQTSIPTVCLPWVGGGDMTTRNRKKGDVVRENPLLVGSFWSGNCCHHSGPQWPYTKIIIISSSSPSSSACSWTPLCHGSELRHHASCVPYEGKMRRGPRNSWACPKRTVGPNRFLKKRRTTSRTRIGAGSRMWIDLKWILSPIHVLARWNSWWLLFLFSFCFGLLGPF